ncbi:MAG: PIN domain-containing protein [Chloroflexota bacterium]|nr:PIN domain-containing protein [Chloroflexota bacterium]
MATFLDTNIILRFLLRDEEAKFQRCFDLLKRAERGEEKLETSDLVISEVVWVLESKPYSLDRDRIRDLVLPIVQLRGLRLSGKRVFERAFQVYGDKAIDFIDAYNAATMERRGLNEIYSYDADFERVEGIKRLEP